MEGIRSSYAENNLGRVIYNQVISCKPSLCVEIGVLDGYSSFHIASALKFLEEKGVLKNPILESYDLFDDYKYNHGNMKSVKKFLTELNLEKYFKLFKADAFTVHERYEDYSVPFLHVDISNDGNVLSRIIEKWNSKIAKDGIIVFEGGSKERDEIEWMKKYNKKSIREEIKKNKTLKSSYVWKTHNAFPSITVMKKIT